MFPGDTWNRRRTGTRWHPARRGSDSPGSDRHQVFDALKSCPYQVALVADRDVATCAGDEGIAERRRETLDRRRFEDSVGIDGQKQIAAGKPCCSVDGSAAAAAGPMADDHVNQALRSRPLRDRACCVGGAVVDDDDFDRSQGLPAQRADRRSKPGAAVECRDNHAYVAWQTVPLALRRFELNRARDTSDNV